MGCGGVGWIGFWWGGVGSHAGRRAGGGGSCLLTLRSFGGVGVGTWELFAYSPLIWGWGGWELLAYSALILGGERNLNGRIFYLHYKVHYPTEGTQLGMPNWGIVLWVQT